jgi:hypothetical protein
MLPNSISLLRILGQLASDRYRIPEELELNFALFRRIIVTTIKENKRASNVCREIGQLLK